MVSPHPTLERATPLRPPYESAPAGHASAPTRRWSLRRTSFVVTALATATALWLGSTAPSQSPVTPAAPAVVAAVDTTTQTDDAATAPDPAVVPALPPDVTVPRGGRGPRR